MYIYNENTDDVHDAMDPMNWLLTCATKIPDIVPLKSDNSSLLDETIVVPHNNKKLLKKCVNYKLKLRHLIKVKEPFLKKFYLEINNDFIYYERNDMILKATDGGNLFSLLIAKEYTEWVLEKSAFEDTLQNVLFYLMDEKITINKKLKPMLSQITNSKVKVQFFFEPTRGINNTRELHSYYISDYLPPPEVTTPINSVSSIKKHVMKPTINYFNTENMFDEIIQQNGTKINIKENFFLKMNKLNKPSRNLKAYLLEMPAISNKNTLQMGEKPCSYYHISKPTWPVSTNIGKGNNEEINNKIGIFCKNVLEEDLNPLSFLKLELPEIISHANNEMKFTTFWNKFGKTKTNVWDINNRNLKTLDEFIFNKQNFEINIWKVDEVLAGTTNVIGNSLKNTKFSICLKKILGLNLSLTASIDNSPDLLLPLIEKTCMKDNVIKEERYDKNINIGTHINDGDTIIKKKKKDEASAKRAFFFDSSLRDLIKRKKSKLDLPLNTGADSTISKVKHGFWSAIFDNTLNTSHINNIPQIDINNRTNNTHPINSIMPASDSLTIKPRLLCKRNNYEIYGKVTKTSYIIANTNIVPIKLLQKLYNTFPESIIVFEQECFKVMRCEFILNASCCIKIINDYKIFQKQSTSNNILLVDDELNDLCIKYKTVFIILTSNLEIHDNNLWKCQILLKSRWPITKLKVAVSTPDYEDIASSILQIVGFVTCIISDRENDCKGIINLDCTGSIDELILIELGLNNFQVKNVLREFKSAYDFINCSKSTKLRILDGNLAQVDSLCKLLSSDFPQVRAL